MGGSLLAVWVAGMWWMWDVLERFDGWFATWRVRGCGWCLPGKLWCIGADWMTLSSANCSWDGATMLRPGGAFLLEVPGVFAGNPPNSLSLALSIGASPGLADCCNRDSMICLCCSRTDKLRCNCSRIVGSCVTKPGERHANPTSWIPSPLLSAPLPVNWLADGLPVPGLALEVFFVRSSFRGLWREDAVISGEDGSFLTIILGGAPFRDLSKL